MMRNDFNLNVNREADEVIIKGYVDDDNQVIITEPDIGGGGGGSAGILKLTFTEDPEDPGTYVCNHTWQEVYNAVSDGVIAVLVEEYTESESEFGISMYMVESVENIDGRYIISNRYGVVASAQAPNDYLILETGQQEEGD